MDQVEEKLKIESEIAIAQKKLKDMLADLDIAKKEQITFESIKAKNVGLIEDQKNELRDTILAISDAKNQWNQQKATEEKELGDKKSAVDAILARSTELDKQEEEINTTKLQVETDRNETRTNLLAIEQGRIAIDVVKREAEAKEIEVQTRHEEVDRKIQNHKENIARVLNEISQI